jgi:hypothetical protein
MPVSLIFEMCATKDQAFRRILRFCNHHIDRVLNENAHCASRLLGRAPASTNDQIFCFLQTPIRARRVLNLFYRLVIAILGLAGSPSYDCKIRRKSTRSFVPLKLPFGHLYHKPG